MDIIERDNHTEMMVDGEIRVIGPGAQDKRTENMKTSDQQLLTKSDIENSNCLETTATDCALNDTHQGAGDAKIPDEMISSQCSTFDATENIVFRRRLKKKSEEAPKKRVSFHEDILKNTKTDNIHIEHGFITYKNGVKQHSTTNPGRYSWCSNNNANNAQDGAHSVGDHEFRGDDNGDYVIYRNACSDMLDYGNSDVYGVAGESTAAPCDNSGVFEYSAPVAADKNDAGLYKCHCSDSNSSLEQEEESSSSSESPPSVDINSNQMNRSKYSQSKSSSCDCIQNNNINPGLVEITDNCYFSEPNITENRSPIRSVWSKERKPKSSCLKKSKYEDFNHVRPDISTKVQTFNIHPLPDLIGNSKMIFGSLKNMFSMPLPERGVPEGSEDVQVVQECVPEYFPAAPQHQHNVPNNMNNKSRPFLSKSLDGGFDSSVSPSKKYIHAVDEQLRKKSEDGSRTGSKRTGRKPSTEIPSKASPKKQEVYRNKFIINCESTVFEHTGISYEAAPIDTTFEDLKSGEFPESKTSFLSGQITKLTSMFKSFKEQPVRPDIMSESNSITPPLRERDDGTGASDNDVMECSITSNSTMTDVSSIVTASVTPESPTSNRGDGFGKIFGTDPKAESSPKTKHLASPLRKKSLTRSGEDQHRVMSPDLFNNFVQFMGHRAPTTDLRTSSLLSEDFDDILTITTNDTDRNDDLVIVDYPEITIPDLPEQSDFLKPATSKTSLINRFLRNVTQKKILEATIKMNQKLIKAGNSTTDGKLFGSLYFKGVKPQNRDLIEDLNAEIAMEIERNQIEDGNVEAKWSVDAGVGEIPTEMFKGVDLLFMACHPGEILLKVFKLYAGYCKEGGSMQPVLVFLTNKTLFVTDLVRSTLCNKFVIPYTALDVILMGPYGHTVLLCNGARDMQQVLLAGGPCPATELVSSLELCARRGGLVLPAIGQLSLNHLAPLQEFVRETLKTVSADEKWLYYAVVCMSTLAGQGSIDGPDSSHRGINGPLMHRTVSRFRSGQWSASYFLLKAGVLYQFSDPHAQRLPTWAVTLTECQGARRVANVGRPHCFELILKHGTLQLAASDEYAASEWLQALVQSASGLFELAEERPAHYGCTMVLTSSHVITMREDFTQPLRRQQQQKKPAEVAAAKKRKDIGVVQDQLLLMDTSSDLSCSSSVSTPTKAAVSSSTSTKGGSSTGRRSGDSLLGAPMAVKGGVAEREPRDATVSNMSSRYGCDSGVEMLSCAPVAELVQVKVSARRSSVWWCSLEFSCQECVQENSDDLVVHFSTGTEHERFLDLLAGAWREQQRQRGGTGGDQFPLVVAADEEDPGAEQCTKLFTNINKMWEPLVSAAMGYPY